MVVLSALGLAGAYAGWGLPAVAGFAAGSAIAYLNFRWMAQLVRSIGEPEGRKPASAILLTFRYLLFAAAGYGIFRYSEIGFLAALAGCFVHIAAVILEVIYELIYAGTP